FYGCFWLAVCQRMQVPHHRFQPLFQYVGVDLRGRNIGVAKKRLHHAQIRTVMQKVAGEGVAQNMRAEARRLDSAGRAERLEFAREMLTRQVTLLSEGRKQPFR